MDEMDFETFSGVRARPLICTFGSCSRRDKVKRPATLPVKPAIPTVIGAMVNNLLDKVTVKALKTRKFTTPFFTNDIQYIGFPLPSHGSEEPVEPSYLPIHLPIFESVTYNSARMKPLMGT